MRWLLASALLPAPALASETPQLSQATVLALHQDLHGDVWIGTEDGLTRMDAAGQVARFRNDALSAHSLPANTVRSIEAATADSLWLGLEGYGLARWSAGGALDTWTPSNSSLVSTDLRALVVDSRGSAWVGFRDGGLQQIDPLEGTTRLFRKRHDPLGSGLHDDRINVLAEAPLGRLWVGTLSGLELFDPATGSSVRVPATANLEIKSLLMTTDDVLWAGTSQELLELRDTLQPETATVRRVERPLSQVSALHRDSEERLWAGTARGLELIDTEQLQARDIALSSAHGGVLSLLESPPGRLWVGTQTAGVQHVDTSTAGVASAPAEPETPLVVTSFAQDTAGRIFVGTFGSGLMTFDEGGAQTHASEAPYGSLGDQTVMALLHDHRHLWIGTKRGGLMRLDPETGETVRYLSQPDDAATLRANGIMSLYQESNGALWVGTFGGGLSRLETATGAFRHYSADSGLTSERITSISSSTGGLLWVGTNGGGLNLLDPERGVKRVLRHAGSGGGMLPHDTVFAVHEDEAGTIWIGSPAGLTRLELSSGPGGTDSTHTFTEADGLANAAVYAIVPDADGYLWLSTNRGLSRFDPFHLRFDNFGESHGFQSEYNFGAALKSANGHLYFGGMAGFDAFDPTDVGP